jgi:hypothetical protein
MLFLKIPWFFINLTRHFCRGSVSTIDLHISTLFSGIQFWRIPREKNYNRLLNNTLLTHICIYVWWRWKDVYYGKHWLWNGLITWEARVKLQDIYRKLYLTFCSWQVNMFLTWFITVIYSLRVYYICAHSNGVTLLWRNGRWSNERLTERSLRNVWTPNRTFFAKCVNA